MQAIFSINEPFHRFLLFAIPFFLMVFTLKAIDDRTYSSNIVCYRATQLIFLLVIINIVNSGSDATHHLTLAVLFLLLLDSPGILRFILIFVYWFIFTSGRSPTILMIGGLIYIYKFHRKYIKYVLFYLALYFVILGPIRNFMRFGEAVNFQFTYENVYENFSYIHLLGARFYDSSFDKIDNFIISSEMVTNIWKTIFGINMFTKDFCFEIQNHLVYCDGITTPAVGPLVPIIVIFESRDFLIFIIAGIIYPIIFYLFYKVNIICKNYRLNYYFLPWVVLSSYDAGFLGLGYIFVINIICNMLILFASKVRFF